MCGRSQEGEKQEGVATMDKHVCARAEPCRRCRCCCPLLFESLIVLSRKGRLSVGC